MFFRRILVTCTLALAMFSAVVWVLGLFPAVARDSSARDIDAPAPTKLVVVPVVKKETGADLYVKVQQAQPARIEQPEPKSGIARDPIVVTNCRLGVIKKQEVPSQRDGVLRFIGTELKPGEKDKIERDRLIEVKTGDQTRYFKALHAGDEVQEGQLLAQLVDDLPQAEVQSKEAKVTASAADVEAAFKTKEEARQRWETQKKLYGTGRGSTSLEDLRGAELTFHRYVSEEISKKQGVIVAKAELNQAQTTLGQYEIRSSLSGDIRIIYKKNGEAVRSTVQADPVFLIENRDRLRAEGMVEVQYAHDLKPGMEVTIEPTRRESPDQTMYGHRGEITGVAVSKDPKNPLIVSASEDGTAMVWERSSRLARRVLQHPSAVRAIACTPPGAEANLALTGDADGQGRIFDLSTNSDKPVVELKYRHRGAITAVAFSPDGKTCATAAEGERNILLFDVATGSPRYSITGHRNTVTSLQFTPSSELVSADRDAIRVWKLGTEAAQETANLKRNSGDITRVGVSPDGKFYLDGQGREMPLVSLETGRPVGLLWNPAQASAFRVLSLFSPDGRLALTTSGADGMLQLWQLGKVRSHELRQLLARERSPVTCAAFSPDGSFVVGGIKDRRVYVWGMPKEEEINQEIKGVITFIEPAVDATESQVKIWAEFNNPGKSLFVGDVVSVVAYPK